RARLAAEQSGLTLDLGRILTELGRVDEAIARHQRAVELAPDSAIAHYLYAQALVYADDPYAAETSCRRAVSLDPNFAPAWSDLGQTLVALGRFDEAQSCFRRALELDPDLPHAYAGLALIGQQADSDAQLRRLRTLVGSSDRPLLTRIDAGFALGMLLDNADRFDEAFPCFAEANARLGQICPHCRAAFRAQIRHRYGSAAGDRKSRPACAVAAAGHRCPPADQSAPSPHRHAANPDRAPAHGGSRIAPRRTGQGPPGFGRDRSRRGQNSGPATRRDDSWSRPHMGRRRKPAPGRRDSAR